MDEAINVLLALLANSSSPGRRSSNRKNRKKEQERKLSVLSDALVGKQNSPKGVRIG